MSFKKLFLKKLSEAGHAMVSPSTYRNRVSYDDLINAESEIGRTIFGPIPFGHQREFFESKKNVWIWHESWRNPSGTTEGMTIRYEVRPTGVYKKVNNLDYTKFQGDELDNFRTAAKTYLNLVKQGLYS